MSGWNYKKLKRVVNQYGIHGRMTRGEAVGKLLKARKNEITSHVLMENVDRMDVNELEDFSKGFGIELGNSVNSRHEIVERISAVVNRRRMTRVSTNARHQEEEDDDDDGGHDNSGGGDQEGHDFRVVGGEVIVSSAEECESASHDHRVVEKVFVLDFELNLFELHHSCGLPSDVQVVGTLTGYPLRGNSLRINMSLAELWDKAMNDLSGLNEATVVTKGVKIIFPHRVGRTVPSRNSAAGRLARASFRFIRNRRNESGVGSCSSFVDNEYVVCYSSYSECEQLSRAYVKRRNGCQNVAYLARPHVSRRSWCRFVVVAVPDRYPCLGYVKQINHVFVVKKPIPDRLVLKNCRMHYDGFIRSHHLSGTMITSKKNYVSSKKKRKSFNPFGKKLRQIHVVRRVDVRLHAIHTRRRKN